MPESGMATTQWKVLDDGRGRSVIRGTGPDGEQIQGYRTASGGWIAYLMGERGWSDAPTSTTPEGAVENALHRNNIG